MKTYLNTLKQFDTNLRYFFTATAVHGFAFFGIYSLLLNLYLLRLGYGPEFIGIANGVGPIVLALASLPAGLISKRIGSRRGLIIGYFFIAVGFSLLPLAEFLPEAFQESWIAGSYAFAWLFAALVIVNYGPYIMSATTEKERNHAFAIQSSLFPVSGFLGNLIGGLLPTFFANMAGVTLESALPYRNALILGGVLYLLSTFAMWCTTEIKAEPVQAEKGRQGESEPQSAPPPIRLIGMVALVSLLIVVGDWTIQLYLNVYLDTVLEASTALIGSLSAAARIFGLMALIAPLAMARFGVKRTLFGALIALPIGSLPLILIPHWAAVGITFIAVIACSSLVNPTYGVFSQSSVITEWRTTIASAISMTTGIAIAITAFGGSAVILAFGYQTLFLIGATSTLLAAVIFGLYFNRQAQPLDVPAPQPIGDTLPEVAM